MNLTGKLKADITKLKKNLTSEDIAFLEVSAGDRDAMLIFAKDMVDKDAIGTLILKPLSKIKSDFKEEEFTSLFLSPEKQEVKSVNEIIDEIVLGNAVIVCDGLKYALSFGLKKFEMRSITEPPTSAVIKGPREGFVESLPVNISLMRRRIKSPDLHFENLTIGEFSKTPVALCYIDGIADQKLVSALREKLRSFKIDAVLDSSYIAKFLGQHKTSIFKQTGNTEKPDILAGKILEGRVAIFVDGSPIALTVPYLLLEDFQSPSDYYS